MTTPPAYTYDRSSGTRANPYSLTPMRNGRSGVMLAVSYGDDVCYVTMDYAEYLAAEDKCIVDECLNNGWLSSGLNEFLEGAVEEVNRIGANSKPRRRASESNE